MKLGPDALAEIVDMLKDLNILTPGFTTNFHVRDHKCMGGPLPDGMNVVNYMAHIDEPHIVFLQPTCPYLTRGYEAQEEEIVLPSVWCF